jgi:hypothetical protein
MVIVETDRVSYVALRNRRGTSSIGCLTMIAIVVAIVYLAIEIGQPYFRYYKFRDAAHQEARFATLRSDDAIRQNLWTSADSLALPEEAYHIKIARTPRIIRISVRYDDSWTVLSYTRQVQFEFDVEDTL